MNNIKCQYTKPMILYENNNFIKFVSIKDLAIYLSSKSTNITRGAKRGFRVNGKFVFYNNKSDLLSCVETVSNWLDETNTRRTDMKQNKLHFLEIALYILSNEIYDEEYIL